MGNAGSAVSLHGAARYTSRPWNSCEPNEAPSMKAALLMTLIALAALAVAYLQYQEAASLRGSLARSEEARLALQAQVDANTTQQANVQQQIQQLQDNLRSSSQQLLQLSNSLQEAREMLVPPTPAP
jgi:cell division protein FtsX